MSDILNTAKYDGLGKGLADNCGEEMLLAVKKAKEKITKLRKADSLVFPLFSDLHTDGPEHEYTKKLISVLEIISENIKCDAVINLGDNLSMLGRRIFITNDELENRLRAILDAVHKAAKVPVINVNGNHDGIGSDFFKPDFWNNIVKGNFGNTSSVYDETGSWYYMDYEKSSTRIVVLSLPYDSDIERDMPAPLWKFGERQLDWLESTALNTEYNVLILSHVPFGYKYDGDREETLGVWDGQSKKLSYIWELCGEIADVERATSIINEFNRKNDKKLVAVLSGHQHKDFVWLPAEEKDGFLNPLPCRQIVTKSVCINCDENSKTGVSIDVVVFTPSENKLDFIRIGDGEDR